MSAPYLALDGGQTGIKLRLVDGAAAYEDSLPGVRTDLPILPQLAAAAAHVRAAGHQFEQLAIGTSGLSAREDDPDALLALVRDLGVRRVLLAHDSIISFLGALGLQRGVVVAAGTGVVTLGVGREAMSRVDGWGYLIGDAGSGFWIGRAALDAVMRAYDGRGPATALTDVALAEFPDLSTAYIEIQSSPARVSRVAAYARAVAELSATDDVARSISEAAGRELAASAAAAARTVGETADPAIALIGGIFRSPFVRDACIAALRESWPTFELADPLGDALAGAVALPAVTPHHPLAPHITISR